MVNRVFTTWREKPPLVFVNIKKRKSKKGVMMASVPTIKCGGEKCPVIFSIKTSLIKNGQIDPSPEELEAIAKNEGWRKNSLSNLLCPDCVSKSIKHRDRRYR